MFTGFLLIFSIGGKKPKIAGNFVTLLPALHAGGVGAA